MSGIHMATLMVGAAPTVVNLTISADTSNYNIFTAAGSPSGPATVTLTINSTIRVFATNTSNFGLDTGTGWAVGSTISIVNNGLIIGAGGSNINTDNSANPTNGDGQTGAAGGTAFRAQFACTFTNAGTVAGGGGAGGIGGNGSAIGGSNGYGGGGGNGRGNSGAQAGNTGGNGGGVGGSGGTAGGAGGPNGTTTGGTGSNGTGNGSSGGGGGGGGWGAAGGNGGRGRNASGVLTSNGGAGGAAGLAATGVSFINGGAGISGGTINGSQT